jgi:hypothetical protein
MASPLGRLLSGEDGFLAHLAPKSLERSTLFVVKSLVTVHGDHGRIPWPEFVPPRSEQDAYRHLLASLWHELPVLLVSEPDQPDE